MFENNDVKNLIDALGATVEMASILRDQLVQNGFTREEAVKMSSEFIIGIIRAAAEQKDGN